MKLHLKLIKKIRKPIFAFTNSIYDNRGLQNLRKNKHLHQALSQYLESSQSTGCSYYDYWTLYHYIRKHQPIEILECGTGVTTIVMAWALMENEQEGVASGRITSMEDVDFWYQQASELIPSELKPYIDLIHSPKVEYSYSIFRGVGYQDIPRRAYEFVFVDGPETTAPSDGTMAFDFDLINVVKNADSPVSAIVDKRVTSCYVYQKIFGTDKVKFDPRCDLCFVGPVTKRDLKSQIGGGRFAHTFRLCGNSELNFIMKS
jgi:hypothetical protein